MVIMSKVHIHYAKHTHSSHIHIHTHWLTSLPSYNDSWWCVVKKRNMNFGLILKSHEKFPRRKLPIGKRIQNALKVQNINTIVFKCTTVISIDKFVSLSLSLKISEKMNSYPKRCEGWWRWWGAIEKVSWDKIRTFWLYRRRTSKTLRIEDGEEVDGWWEIREMRDRRKGKTRNQSLFLPSFHS